MLAWEFIRSIYRWLVGKSDPGGGHRPPDFSFTGDDRALLKSAAADAKAGAKTGSENAGAIAHAHTHLLTIIDLLRQILAGGGGQPSDDAAAIAALSVRVRAMIAKLTDAAARDTRS